MTIRFTNHYYSSIISALIPSPHMRAIGKVSSHEHRGIYGWIFFWTALVYLYILVNKEFHLYRVESTLQSHYLQIKS